MKRTIAWVLGVLLGAVFLIPSGPAAPASAAPYCGITWGSQVKKDAGSAPETSLVDVRAGRHTCYDRLVLDVDGNLNGWDVRYVTQVYAEGSGKPVPVAGAADLQIVLRSPAYDSHGNVTFDPSDPRHIVNVAGFATFDQVAFAGSFEGQTTLALGVRARLPFRVLVLDGPGDTTRLVIDVAHRW